MPAPVTRDEAIELLRKCRLFEAGELDSLLQQQDEQEPVLLLDKLRLAGHLTAFQCAQLQKGKHKGFVLGKYKLQDRIGMGGMGQVFLAKHSTMGRLVALKVLPPERARNEFAQKRFLREAKATGQLNHPNVVRAFDVDKDQDVHFLVLEFVDGLSFQELVTRHGPLSAERVGHYLYQTVSGLKYLHEQGMIHRDIKPANLMIDRSGVVKILDLGLVRSEDDQEELTRKEDVKFLGTADYLAPEQAVSCTTVDGRADQYSLGATAYFMLTGTPPHTGETVAQKLLAHQTNEVKLLHIARPNIPMNLSLAIHRMMSRDAQDRFANLSDLLVLLQEWANAPGGEELELPKTTPPIHKATAQQATVNLEPKAAIRTGSKPVITREGNQSSGSGIRFYGDSNGSGSNAPGYSSGTKSSPPVFITPPPQPSHIPVSTPVSIPEPVAKKSNKNRPPVLPVKPPTIPAVKAPEPELAKVETPKPAPQVLKTPFAETNKAEAVSPRRSWVGIAAGFLVAVLITAWTTITKAGGGRS